MTSTNKAALETIAPAIQQLLASSGLTLDEIAAHVADPNSVTPTATTTVAEAVAAAIEALSPGTVKTYRTYRRLLCDGITVPGTWDEDRRRATKGQPPRRRHGKGAQENFIAATRSLYNAAQANDLVADGVSPAAKVSKPPRSGEATRRAMTDQELADVWRTISTTGDDPALDTLIFRLQLETAARQEGCINLRLRHLDVERQSVWLDQKGDELKEFPVTEGLLRDLLDFAHSRGAGDPSDHVLRFKHKHRHTGEQHPPLTGRRFDTIHDRVHRQHRWENLAAWSSHWFRHHTAAEIESIGGRPCKMRILAHKPNGQTDGYARATPDTRLGGGDHDRSAPPARAASPVDHGLNVEQFRNHCRRHRDTAARLSQGATPWWSCAFSWDDAGRVPRCPYELWPTRDVTARRTAKSPPAGPERRDAGVGALSRSPVGSWKRVEVSCAPASCSPPGLR